MTKSSTAIDIFKFILPTGITTYFEVKSVKESAQKLTIVLEEKNSVPQEHEGKKLISKGFYPSTFLQDFPIREYKVFLEIRRRKWRDTDTGKTVSRDWQLAAKGTSLTTEFGAFLKEMVRYLPSQR